MVMGLIRMVLDFVYLLPQCDQPDNRPAVVKYVHYLYFSIILSIVTLVVVVTVSLLTEPPPEQMVRTARSLSALVILLYIFDIRPLESCSWGPSNLPTGLEH